MKYSLNYLFIGLFMLGCRSEESRKDFQIKVLFEKALSLDNVKQGDEIQEMLYDSILSLNDSHADTWYEKSSWSIKIGDYVNHFKFLNKAVKLEPKIYTGYRGAMKLFYLRDYDGAIEDFKKQISFYPEQQNIAAWGRPTLFLLGKAYWQKGEYKTAIMHFEKYIKEEQETTGIEWVDVRTYWYLGLCQKEIGELTNALKSFEKGIVRYEQFTEAYYHSAKIFIELNQPEKACEYLEKALYHGLQGSIHIDSFREVFGQIYLSDIEEAIENSCTK